MRHPKSCFLILIVIFQYSLIFGDLERHPVTINCGAYFNISYLYFKNVTEDDVLERERGRKKSRSGCGRSRRNQSRRLWN